MHLHNIPRRGRLAAWVNVPERAFGMRKLLKSPSSTWQLTALLNARTPVHHSHAETVQIEHCKKQKCQQVTTHILNYQGRIGQQLIYIIWLQLSFFYCFQDYCIELLVCSYLTLKISSCYSRDQMLKLPFQVSIFNVQGRFCWKLCSISLFYHSELVGNKVKVENPVSDIVSYSK